MKGTTEAAPLPASEPTSSVPIDTVAMDKHLVGGIAWTAAAKWSSQILAWACLLIVARKLMPSDFGLIGMAAVYLGLVNIFSECGFGSAVITLRNLTVADIAQINSFSVISGMIGFLISCALAQPLGWFFRSPQLPAVVVVMSTALIISGFKTVPYSLLQRELEFKRLSVIDTATAVTQSLCILVLAWMGAGYWALVLGNLAGVAISTGLNVALRPRGFASPRLQSIGHALSFSWQVLVARLSWNFYSDADFLVAGRVLGVTPLGAYTFAWNLATLPVEKVTSLVAQVTPAFFSATQSDSGGLYRYLRALTEALSLVTFPASIGLALIAPEFVTLVLGKSWSGVIAPLEVLAFYGSIRSISALLGPLLTALRETRLMMWNNLAAAVVMPTAFYVGSHWGASGIAWGWIVAYPFIALPLYLRTFRRIGMSVRTYVDALRPALNGSLAMIVAVSVLRWAIPPTWPLYVRFGMELTGGGAAYLIVLSVLHADRLRSFVSLYRRIRASNSAIATG
jgi:O-antigen/teichoic acid export membrane protein